GRYHHIRCEIQQSSRSPAGLLGCAVLAFLASISSASPLPQLCCSSPRSMDSSSLEFAPDDSLSNVGTRGSEVSPSQVGHNPGWDFCSGTTLAGRPDTTLSIWPAHRSSAVFFSAAYAARLYVPATPALAPLTWFRQASMM